VRTQRRKSGVTLERTNRQQIALFHGPRKHFQTLVNLSKGQMKDPYKERRDIGRGRTACNTTMMATQVELSR